MAGTESELKAAQIIQQEISAIGLDGVIEPFTINDSITTAKLVVTSPYRKEDAATGHVACQLLPKAKNSTFSMQKTSMTSTLPTPKINSSS